MIPATVEQAVEAHINAIIEEELGKLPAIVGHLIPGLAGLLVQGALSSDVVQAEAKKLIEKGADFAIAESVKGLNELQAAVLTFMTKHPALQELYVVLHPTLTNNQVLHLTADEARKLYTFLNLGGRAEFDKFIGALAG